MSAPPVTSSIKGILRLLLSELPRRGVRYSEPRGFCRQNPRGSEYLTPRRGSSERSKRKIPLIDDVTGGADMPELPEVETAGRDIRPCLVQRLFTTVQMNRAALR